MSNAQTCPLFDDLYWITHRFFGREMGVTNTLVGVQKFGQFDGLVFFMPQSHSDVIITPDDPLPVGGADAVITDQPQMGLAVKTADCVPILLVCTQTRLIAAAHAGWAGGLNGIVPKTVARMVAQGANPHTIRAALGPSLHAMTFGVRQDLYDRFAAEQPSYLAFFTPIGDSYLFDLNGLLAHQLQAQGVTQIWQSGINTFGSAQHFSFRRRQDDPIHEHSRNVSVIMRTK